MSTLTTIQVAAILELTPGRVRQLARSGDLVGTRLGRDWTFEGEAVLAYHLQRFKANPRKTASPGPI